MGIIKKISIFRKMTDLKKENVKTPKNYQYVRGDYRLSNGLYRTPKDAEEYIQKSLKRKLP